jgi:hypothetical protein
MGLAPGGGLMMAGTMVAFAGVCIVLVRVFEIPDYGVLFVVGFGILLLGILRRLTWKSRPRARNDSASAAPQHTTRVQASNSAPSVIEVIREGLWNRVHSPGYFWKAVGGCLAVFGVAAVIGGVWECLGVAFTWPFGLGAECSGMPILIGLAMVGAGALMYGGLPWNSN